MNKGHLFVLMLLTSILVHSQPSKILDGPRTAPTGDITLSELKGINYEDLDNKQKGYYKYYEAWANQYNRSLPKSLLQFYESLEFFGSVWFKTENDYLHIIRANKNLAQIFGWTGHYDEAIKYTELIQPFLSKIPSKNYDEEFFDFHHNLGYFYWKNGNIKDGLDYLTLARNVAKKESRKYQAIVKIGRALTDNKTYDLAEKNYLDLLESKIDKKKNGKYRAQALVNLGYISELKGDTSKALRYYQRGRLAHKNSDSFTVLQNIGEIHLAQQRVDSAKAYFEMAFSVRPKELSLKSVRIRSLLGAAGAGEEQFIFLSEELAALQIQAVEIDFVLKNYTIKIISNQYHYNKEIVNVLNWIKWLAIVLGLAFITTIGFMWYSRRKRIMSVENVEED